MSKIERNVRNQKHDSDKYVKFSNHIQSCSTPPPPPPFGDEEGWDLQFCKWWGWNWVRKEQNYVSKIDRELLFDPRPLREQPMKNIQKMRGAGDVPLQKPKHEKYRYFKHIRNLFVKLKHTSSLQKFFNTPSASHRCCCATCSYGIKEKKFVPFADNKRCCLEEEGRIKTWSNGEVGNSSGSTSVGLCPSLKEMDFDRGKCFQNDLLVTNMDNFQQTQENRKTKKKKYFHLVCNSCYPKICCCRCHREANPEELQCSLPFKSNPKDSLRASKCPFSTNKPSENIKPKRITESPPGDYNYQQEIRRPYFLSRWRCQPQTQQVRGHRCTQNEEYSSYVGAKEHGNSCRHGSHPLCSNHQAYGNNICSLKCRDENREEMFDTQIIPEKDHPNFLDVKTKHYVFPEKLVGLNRRRAPLPALSESTFSDNAIEKPFCSEYISSKKSVSPSKRFSKEYSVKRRSNQNGGDCNMEIKNQLRRERQEEQRWDEKNVRSSQEHRRRLRCQSFPESSKHKASPTCLNWPPPQQADYSGDLPNHKLQTPIVNQRVRDCPTYQKLPPYRNMLNEPAQPLFETKTKRTSRVIHSYNSPDVPCKRPRMCDTPENNIYRDYNRITFGKKMFPKFRSYDQMYPQIQNTRSDILDRHYSLKVEEEFFSPISGKKYNISPRTIIDPECYTSSSLPDPIDVHEDLKYLESLEATVKVDRSSRIMLDAVCDAILFSTNNKQRNTESTLIRKFSYPDVDKGSCNSKCAETLRQYSPANPASRNSELVFMEKVEALVKSILNSKLAQNQNGNGDIIDRSSIERHNSPVVSEPSKTYRLAEIKADSQKSIGNSILEQFNKFDNLFEKIDEATILNKTNVKKIQEAIQSLPEIKEDSSSLKDSTDQQFSVSLLDQIASTSNKEGKQKQLDMLEQVNRFPKNNENCLESSTSEMNLMRKFNMQSRHSSDNPRDTSNFIFKNVSDVPINSKIPVSQQILSNSQSVPISRTRRGFKHVVKNRKLKTRIPIRKKI